MYIGRIIVKLKIYAGLGLGVQLGDMFENTPEDSYKVSDHDLDILTPACPP